MPSHRYSRSASSAVLTSGSTASDRTAVSPKNTRHQATPEPATTSAPAPSPHRAAPSEGQRDHWRGAVGAGGATAEIGARRGDGRLHAVERGAHIHRRRITSPRILDEAAGDRRAELRRDVSRDWTGSSLRIAALSSNGVLPLNGRAPVAISSSTTPSAQMSQARARGRRAIARATCTAACRPRSLLASARHDSASPRQSCLNQRLASQVRSPAP